MFSFYMHNVYQAYTFFNKNHFIRSTRFNSGGKLEHFEDNIESDFRFLDKNCSLQHIGFYEIFSL